MFPYGTLPFSFCTQKLQKHITVHFQCRGPKIPQEGVHEGCTVYELLQELLKMKLSSGIFQYIGMKKPPVGAGTVCPLHILVFYIPPCRKYLPVSGAKTSPCCYRKIPEEPQKKCSEKLPPA
jgi:hypothetical protein